MKSHGQSPCSIHLHLRVMLNKPLWGLECIKTIHQAVLLFFMLKNLHIFKPRSLMMLQFNLYLQNLEIWQSTCQRKPGRGKPHCSKSPSRDNRNSNKSTIWIYWTVFCCKGQRIISIVLKALENDTKTIYDAVYKTSVTFWLFLQNLK